MRSVELSSMGFPGFTLFEDGRIQRPDSSVIEGPYASGQVALSYKGRTRYMALAKLVGYYFVENLNAYTQIKYLDGNRLNCRADNLEWVSTRRKVPKRDFMDLRADVIAMHVNGTDPVRIQAQTRLAMRQVEEIIEDFEQMVREAP